MGIRRYVHGRRLGGSLGVDRPWAGPDVRADLWAIVARAVVPHLRWRGAEPLPSTPRRPCAADPRPTHGLTSAVYEELPTVLTPAVPQKDDATAGVRPVANS